MTKKLSITPAIEAAIAKSTDGSVDASNVSVYECIALNTLPLGKKGTLFQGGRVSETTLRQMADYLNAGKFVPLHNNHDQTSGGLPVGRVFMGEVNVRPDGIAELRTLFYLPNTETELINKIEGGAIEEVSAGLQALHLNCSECGFDYRGPDATFSNIWECTCENGHTVGENGVHVILNGMDRYMEQSLVSLGAANNAKILSRTKSILGQETYQQLAASGIPPETTILFANMSLPKEPKLDINAMIAQLSDVKAEKKVVDGQLAAATASVATLNQQVADLQTQVTTLQAAAQPPADVAAVQAQLADVQTQSNSALAFIRAEADRLSVALGEAKPAEDASLEVLTASIESARTKLSQNLPTGGKSIGTGSGDGKEVISGPAPALFKTR